MKNKDSEAWRIRPPCPICWHRETMRARLHGGDPSDTTPADHLEWHRPFGGAKGQQITRWDMGSWRCPGCGAAFTPDDAAILLDAVLRNGFGTDEATIDKWTTEAWNGGRHAKSKNT
jgi:hypothetical protein